jgi:hypothetical protein
VRLERAITAAFLEAITPKTLDYEPPHSGHAHAGVDHQFG